MNLYLSNARKAQGVFKQYFLFEIGDGIDIRDDHCDMGIEAGVDENCIVRWVRMGIGG